MRTIEKSQVFSGVIITNNKCYCKGLLFNKQNKMIVFSIIILALIQSLTEFLPVSSSAHILLISKIINIELLNLNDDVIAISLHIGSLIAVILFYYTEILKILTLKNIQLLKNIILSFIPIAFVGMLIMFLNIQLSKSNILMGVMLIIFGIILYITDRLKNQKKSVENINTYDALLIGILQVLALIPGVSRSGITITAGRIIGLTRDSAVKYSLLLLIPTIGASSVVLIYKLYKTPFLSINQNLELLAILAIILSTIFSYIVLKIFVKLSTKITFTPFVIYRILIGIIILITLNRV